MRFLKFSILAFILLCISCAPQHYIKQSGGVLIDSIATYRNDEKGICFYFGHHMTQYGNLPVTSSVNKVLSFCEFNPKSDTILFIGAGILCVERYTVPYYLEKQSPKREKYQYQTCPLLETKDNNPAGPIYENGFHCMNYQLKKMPRSDEIIQLLSSSTFTRKVRMFKRQKAIVTEDLLPYKGHYIALIYYTKKREDWSDTIRWDTGTLECDPTTLNNLLNRETVRWKYDVSLRTTRENGMRLKLQMDPDSLCKRCADDYIGQLNTKK